MQVVAAHNIVDQPRAVALPRNLIAVPRAGLMTARVRRYRSPFSSVHAKRRAGEIQQLDDTTQQEMENGKENL